MVEPGRNQPCPCGSGKKFKQCHGKPGGSTASPQERAWQQLRRALDGFPARMLRFVGQTYGPGAVHEAWAEFLLWPEDDPAFDPDTPHMPVFMPWFFHRWAPDPHETSVQDESVHGRSPSSMMLERRARRLDPRLRRYLEACVETPFSFHEILRCDPGVGFRTRDVFVGTEHEVLERTASRSFQVGDSFFGQVVTSDGVTLMEASGRYVIPPREKIEIIDLREQMKEGVSPPTPETLGDWDLELREAYLDITDMIVHRPSPLLQNTDGEDIEFHRLSFEIGSAQEAFAALKHLSFGETEGELLESAELDEEGRVHRVFLAWTVPGNRAHAGWDNTVLGEIEIDGTRLVANFNSAERAARFREVVEECLGEDARYEGAEVQSLEEAMREQPATDAPPERGEGPDLSESPEVRERIREMMHAHYERWLDEEIPALGGLSPLKAVQNPAGREKVEALIDDIERTGRRMEPPLDDDVIRSLRERLGLI